MKLSLHLAWLTTIAIAVSGPSTTLRAQSPVADFDLRLPTALPTSTTLSVALPTGAPVTLSLRKHSVRADDFAIWASRSVGHREPAPPPPVRTYRGSIREIAGTRVAASLEPEGLFAILRDSASPAIYSIAPAPTPSRPMRHVVRAVDPFDIADCGTTHEHHAHRATGAARLPGATSRLGTTRSDPRQVCEIAFDCDYELYVRRSSSVASVVTLVERTMEASNLVFEQDVDLLHRITAIVVRTAEPDPYDGNDANAILGDQFRSEWLNNQTHIRRDLAHFLSPRDFGNVLGLAYVGVVCSPTFSFGLTRITNFSTDVSVLTHELGHNWDCPHCLDPNDVMCGGGSAGGFGPNNQAQIRAHTASRPCLGFAQPELVAHWRFDEAAGATAFADSGPAGLVATPNGLVVSGAAGAAAASGSAASFPGGGSVATLPHAAALDPLADGFTISMWIRPGAGGFTQRIFGNETGFTLGLGFGRPQILLFGGGGGASASAPIPRGAWSHLAVTVLPGDQATFWLNGSNPETRPLPGTLAGPGANWFFGARDAAGSDGFVGEIDDLQLWAGTLASGDIAWLASHPGDRPLPSGWTNYGTGVGGAVGVPTLSATGSFEVGRPLQLDLGPASGLPIVSGALVVGIDQADLPLLGGRVLVDLTTGFAIPRLFNGFGSPIPMRLPPDPALASTPLYFQVLVIDGSAPQGVVFTPGLRVVLD